MAGHTAQSNWAPVLGGKGRGNLPVSSRNLMLHYTYLMSLVIGDHSYSCWFIFYFGIKN